MLRIEIGTDNAAFADHAPSEVARILRALADKLDHCHGLPAHAPLHDVNGNRVGFAQEEADESACRNCDGAGCRHCDRDASY